MLYFSEISFYDLFLEDYQLFLIMIYTKSIRINAESSKVEGDIQGTVYSIQPYWIYTIAVLRKADTMWTIPE